MIVVPGSYVRLQKALAFIPVNKVVDVDPDDFCITDYVEKEPGTPALVIAMNDDDSKLTVVTCCIGGEVFNTYIPWDQVDECFKEA
jgi:hypothetical protein